jgi:hypothetical protein
VDVEFFDVVVEFFLEHVVDHGDILVADLIEREG